MLTEAELPAGYAYSVTTLEGETDAINAAGSSLEPDGIAPTQSSSPGRRLAVNTLIVSGAFVLSRVLGLVRDAILLRMFGTSGQYDAYLFAFGIPDTLFVLIIGGAAGSAFIPVFTRLLSKGKDESAWHLVSTLINSSVVLLSLMGIIFGFLAPTLVGTIIAPSSDPAEQRLVVDLTRILLFSPLFMGLGGWAQSILNARQSFTLSALAPVAYNLAIIGGAFFFAPYIGINGVALGVVLGALLHFGVQVPGLVRTGTRYSFRINLRDEGVKEVGKLLLPRLVGQAAFQTNIIAAKAIGSFLAPGLITAFNSAYNLMILPHGVFAMSLATVTFPTMAAQSAANNLGEMRSTLAKAIKVLLFFTLPSAAGLFALRSEIVAALFQSGRFTSESTALVAAALFYFAPGLVAYAVVEVITRAFYALHDTVTPVVISVSTVALNVAISFALVRFLGWKQEGLALSLAFTTTLEMITLWLLLSRKLPGWSLFSDGLITSAVKSSASALLMAGLLLVLLPQLHAMMPDSNSKVVAIVIVAISIAAGGAVYLGTALLLRSEELGDAMRMVLRRRR
ncbi:MAG: murein biosynthesis integral membrane protein MurJ [Chloroflexota bacterium]|nr:murein biosynthesis integral membrane protein MurJ [Chloroflexota bacterium]